MSAMTCDLIGLFGLALVSAGLWLIYPPLTFVALGGVLCVVAIMLATRAKK